MNTAHCQLFFRGSIGSVTSAPYFWSWALPSPRIDASVYRPTWHRAALLLADKKRLLMPSRLVVAYVRDRCKAIHARSQRSLLVSK